MRVEHADEFVSGDAIVEITRAASAAGFSAVFVTDHPAPDTRWLDTGGHHALDPFVALSFAAAADPAIKLHTNIYVAGYRNPFLGAKLVHSLDVLSGGRVILGVAAGYLKYEFAALGVDVEHRGELLDEALAVLDAVSRGDDVAWEGAHSRFTARGVRLRPVPPGGRRPPVWVGGNSKAALRRAARFDGWAPFHTGGFARAVRTATLESPTELKERIALVRALAAEGGRTEPFDVCWSEPLDWSAAMSADERCAHVRALEAAGVTWLGVTPPGDDRAELVERIAALGREVIAPLEAA